MIRATTILILALALSACSWFRDYRVGVNNPTEQDTVQEQTYYDYSKRDTIHQKPGTYR
jgi:hypothetical protein